MANNTSTKVVWNNEIYIKHKSFIAALLLSSSPFLGTIIILFFMFAVLSRLFTSIRQQKRLKLAKDQLHMENFVELVTYGKPHDFSDNDHTFEELMGQNLRERNLQKHHSRRQKKRKAGFNFRRKKSLSELPTELPELNLPDEDRCPIELVNDVLAKHGKKHSFSNGGPIFTVQNQNGNDDQSSDQIEMDQDILNTINDLIRPGESFISHHRTNKPIIIVSSNEHIDSNSDVAGTLSPSASFMLVQAATANVGGKMPKKKRISSEDNKLNEQLSKNNHQDGVGVAPRIKIVVEDYDQLIHTIDEVSTTKEKEEK